jgi:hypothetical protein
VYDGAGAGLDWSPLGGNPVPGDPGQVRGLASRFDQIADEVGVQVSRLRRVAEDMGGAGVWAGPAAEACRPHLDKLPGLLDKVVVSYRKAGDALAGYAPKLSAAQDKAVHALRMATEALSEQASAQTAVRHKLTSSNGSGTDAGPSPAGMLLSTLIATDPGVQAAGDKLQKAHDLASEAAGDCKNAASTCADGIHSASDAGIQNPGFFQSIGNDIDGGFEHAWDFAVDAFHYVKDHWVDIVKTISSIAGKLSAVFGVLALATFWIPGVGEVFDAAALATGGVALAGDSLLAATGHGSWSQVAMDGVCVAGAGVARVLGRGADALRAGKGAEDGLARAAKARGVEGFEPGSKSSKVFTIIGKDGSETVGDGRSVSITRVVDGGAETKVHPTTTWGAVKTGARPLRRLVTEPAKDLRQAPVLLRDGTKNTYRWVEKGHHFAGLKDETRVTLNELRGAGNPAVVRLQRATFGTNVANTGLGVQSAGWGVPSRPPYSQSQPAPTP